MSTAIFAFLLLPNRHDWSISSGLANTNPTYIAVSTRDLVHPYIPEESTLFTSTENGPGMWLCVFKGINNNAIVSGYMRSGDTQSHVILQSNDQGNTWDVINNSLTHIGRIVVFSTKNKITFLQFGIDKQTLRGQLSASTDGKAWHTTLFPPYTYISSITKVQAATYLQHRVTFFTGTHGIDAFFIENNLFENK